MQRLRLALFAPLAFALAVPLAHAQAPAPSSSCTPKGNAPMKVKLTTSMGPIVIELNKDKAPISTENFVKYVESGHYNGTVFHRVINGFMIQGGGFTKEMQQKPTNAPIKNEASNGLKNDVYTVAMARTNVRDSATSQFFINVKDNASLNAPSPDGYGYTVFGKVVSGTEVVDKIRAARTGNKGGMQDVPVETITIQSATVVAK